MAAGQAAERARERRELSDLEQMRAVSHPARWRVLEELATGRTLTATEAARLVGLTPSAMSYHLNQLARLGLIEPDDSTDGREHPWRALTGGVSMTAQPDAPLGLTMMQNLNRSVARLLGTPAPAAADRRPWPAAFSHDSLSLTKQQAKELHERIRAVVAEYRADASGQSRSVSGERNDYEVFWIQGVAAAD